MTYNNKHIIQLPKENGEFYKYDLENIIKINGFEKEDRYYNLPANHHHFLTRCYRDKIIPKLNALLQFGFKLSDFNIIKNETIGEDKKVVDLSYLKPKHDAIFTVTGFEYGIEYTSNFSGLMWNEKVSGTTYFSPFHKLYCFPHSTSRIINKTIKNNRSIVCNGDSCLIPIIPILACYYKEVWYLDNRNRKKLLPKEFEKENFDDYLIMPFDKVLSYYLENNLKKNE